MCFIFEMLLELLTQKVKKMPTYNVLLTRSYSVEIEAKNEKDARELTEFFLDDIRDGSRKSDREKHGFEFLKITPEVNDAFEVNKISSDI
jgi:hypothetical protein